MPHLADGEPYSATLSARGIPLVAVGWLSSVHEFDRGRVSEAFFRVLCGHLTARWEPPYACAGMHDCDLCQFGRSTTRFKDFEFGSASGSELFIPSGDSIFVAPVNIAHYIAAHHYQPPADFIRAGETCPQQRTAAYMQLLLSSGAESGSPRWTRHLRHDCDHHQPKGKPSRLHSRKERATQCPR